MSIEERIAEVLREHEYSAGFETNCACGVPGIWFWVDYRAHVASVLVAELRAQMPTVAFKGPSDSDAGAFRRMAQNLDNGYEPGGGNAKAAASRLFRWAADLLDTAPKAELEVRAKAGWERVL